MIDISFDINQFVRDNAWAGFILFFVSIGMFVIERVGKNSVHYQKAKDFVITPIATKLKFKFLQKAAIKNNIQAKVNSVVNEISGEIPNNNLKQLEIEWINSITREKFFKDNKIIVRLRPLKDQDLNLINVTQPYLEMTLIPKAQYALEDVQKKAIIHFATQEILKAKKKMEAENKFYKDYYLRDCKKHNKLVDYFEKIDLANNRGMFFGIVLPAIEEASNDARYKNMKLGSDFSQILNHINKFIEEYDTDTPDGITKWDFKTKEVSYALMLVASPGRADRGDTKPYLRRAKASLKDVSILFISFSNDEAAFGNRVAEDMEEDLNVELLANLDTKHDYRGNAGGIVKIYKKLDD